MNAPGLFPIVGNGGESLKQRLEHVLAGLRSSPKIGRRWIAAATLFALVAIAGIGFAQQGKRAPAPSPGPASNAEIANGTKLEGPPASRKPVPHTPVLPRDVSKLDTPTTIRQVQGRVLFPNGQPAVGATVRATRTKFRPGGFAREPEVQLLATFSTDSKGQFHGSVDNVSKEELRIDRNPRDVRIVNLWATLPGYGAVVQQFVATHNSDPIVLQLVDEEPIHGRIIDLEGRPVREARVEIINHFTTTSAFVDQWLASASGKEKPRFSVRELTSEPHEWAKNNRDYAILRGTSSDFASDAIFPAAQTDSDGRFELRGVGRDREVVLRISGSRITANRARIVTRPIKSIPFQWHEISGSQFQIVAQPSVPVEGLVTDIDSGKPIPGALILPQSVARDRGPVEGLGAPVSAATDSQGHYRLEGLETNSFNYLSVVVPDLPYFWARFVDVPTAKSLKPIRRDIQLKRGIWAVGRAYDQSTSKPVSGRVSYLPFRSNEFARKYPTIQSNFNSNFPDPVVDAEGRFRVLVAPGRGVVRLTCSVGDYRFNFGESQTKEFDDPGLWTTMFHAVREINVAPDAPEVALDLPVVPGQNIVLHFTDAAGKRLAGIETYGLRFPNPRSVPERGKSFVKGDWATLYATYPGEARTIWLRHCSSGLARLLQFSPKAGETKRTIILEPPAVVTGHVTTPEGAPLSNRKIDCRFNGADVIELPSALGDVDGRFRAELPAGGPFSLSFQNLVVRLADDLTVVAGEQVDLGDMTIASNEKRPGKTKIHRGLEKRTKPNAAANASTASASVSTLREMPDPDTLRVNASQRDEPTLAREPVPASSDQAVQNVSGVIVNEKGEPLAGARVAVIARLKRTRRGGDLGESPCILGEAVTEAGGKFRLRVPRIPSTGVWFSKLIARGDGYGLAGRALKTDVDLPDLKLTLPPEQVLRGRFVDLQGQPVAGVRARVQSILPTRNGQSSDAIGFPAAGPEPTAWPGDCVSDAAGRFTIRGIGVGQGVSLFIEGSEKLAPQSATINSGQSERREANDATYRPQAVANLKTGEEGVVPLAPAQFFEGTVRFADTKQPAPNARLTIYASQQEFGGSFLGLNGQADAQGHFRINAYPGVIFQITAYPPDGTAYLTRQITARSKSGESLRNVVVDLPRGVLVRGRIVDSADNRPIPNCSIQYVPTSAATRRAPAGALTGWQAIELSDPRGEFAIPVLSGLGHLLVYGPTSDYVYQEAGDRELSEGHSGGRRNYAQAISRIDPPTDSTSPIDLTIKLRRVAPVSGRLLTPDGQPVEESLMISRLQINPLSPTWRANTAEFVRGGRFAVAGCGAGVECPICFLDPQHETGATVRMENNSASQQPLTVRLAPCGAAKARFVDSDGKPIADLEPSLHLVVTPGPSPFDRSPAARGQLSADEDFASNVDRKNQLPFPKAGADGVATFRVLIPGATYRLVGGRNRELGVLKEFSAEAGKTLDLGDVVADRPRER